MFDGLNVKMPSVQTIFKKESSLTPVAQTRARGLNALPAEIWLDVADRLELRDLRALTFADGMFAKLCALTPVKRRFETDLARLRNRTWHLDCLPHAKSRRYTIAHRIVRHFRSDPIVKLIEDWQLEQIRLHDLDQYCRSHQCDEYGTPLSLC